MKTRGTAKLSESLDQRLGLYSLAATAAGVGLMALAQPAEGRIVYTPAHKVIFRGGAHTLDLDLNHDGMIDFQVDLEGVTNGSFVAAYPYAGGNRVWTTASGWASALRAGVRIGPKMRPAKPPKGGAFMEGFECRSTCRTGGQWATVKNRYLGLAFSIAGKTHYGWARLSTSLKHDGRFEVRATLTGYAYETIPNKPIITGKTAGRDEVGGAEQPDPAALTVPTPQPAALGLLALGSRGLSIWRRKEPALAGD